MLIYLDTCSIQRPFDDQSQIRVALESEAVLRIIKLVEQGDLGLLSSETLLVETDQNPYERRRRFAQSVFFLSDRLVETTRDVESLARQYENVGLRPFDALHLASAVESGADVLCSTDDQLLRRGSEANTKTTRLFSPIELIEEVQS